MNVENPILTAESEATLQDGVTVIVRGKVFDRPIFPGAEPMFNRVEVVNKMSGILMGEAYYKDPMDSEELSNKVNEVASDPGFIETILHPRYQKHG